MVRRMQERGRRRPRLVRGDFVEAPSLGTFWGHSWLEDIASAVVATSLKHEGDRQGLCLLHHFASSGATSLKQRDAYLAGGGQGDDFAYSEATSLKRHQIGFGRAVRDGRLRLFGSDFVEAARTTNRRRAYRTTAPLRRRLL